MEDRVRIALTRQSVRWYSSFNSGGVLASHPVLTAARRHPLPRRFEDPLDFVYPDAWVKLKQATRVSILTGEKVGIVAGYRPYLDKGTVDMVHPRPGILGRYHGLPEDRRLRGPDAAPHNAERRSIQARRPTAVKGAKLKGAAQDLFCAHFAGLP